LAWSVERSLDDPTDEPFRSRNTDLLISLEQETRRLAESSSRAENP
jgi:hypothetical protein